MAILSAGLNHPQGGQMQYEFYSGGTSYMVNVFTQSGTLYVPVSKTAVILLVGGGGSGGAAYGDNDTGKGGGGAGGCCLHTSYSLTSGTSLYRIIVGNGGKGRYKTNNDGTLAKAGTNSGDDTKAFGVIAKGGGQGGQSDNYLRSLDGGCGGGAGARNSNSGWNNGAGSTQSSYSGWSTYGYSGGNSAQGNYSGAGGGGIGGNGSDRSGGSNDSNSQGGAGGAGRDFSSYFGTRVGDRGWFGGGGGGGTYRHGTDTVYQAPGNGGSSNYGGGGYGAGARESSQNSGAFSIDQINAMDGTGGGGGGASECRSGNRQDNRESGAVNGSGGSGIVIVRTPI